MAVFFEYPWALAGAFLLLSAGVTLVGGGIAGRLSGAVRAWSGTALALILLLGLSGGFGAVMFVGALMWFPAACGALVGVMILSFWDVKGPRFPVRVRVGTLVLGLLCVAGWGLILVASRGALWR